MTQDTRIRIIRVSHMRYRHVDLDKARQFLEDFGMELAYSDNDGKTLYFAGQGPDAYCYVAEQGAAEFLGGAFLVETKADLEKARALPGATDIVPAGPAGGLMITFRDPDDIPMSLVWGLEERKPKTTPKEVPDINYPVQKIRKGEFRRFEKGPCPVFKLGHFGHLVSDFDKTYEFFTTHFNLKATDILHNPEGKNVSAFTHVDREEEWVDHHTFFFRQSAERQGVHHCSFEVNDPDVQAIGHEWLVSKGYTPSWGVGRHILGSQVFDYWYTPDDFMIEHYSDGDLVNCDTPTGWILAGPQSLAIWGPAVPHGFHNATPDHSMAAPVAACSPRCST